MNTGQGAVISGFVIYIDYQSIYAGEGADDNIGRE